MAPRGEYVYGLTPCYPKARREIGKLLIVIVTILLGISQSPWTNLKFF
jgi:hypothetical protein